MSRRVVFLATLAFCGGAAAVLAPMSSAAPAYGSNGCPTQSPVYESNGHDYVIVPLNLDGNSPCGTTYELPVTVPPTF